MSRDSPSPLSEGDDYYLSRSAGDLPYNSITPTDLPYISRSAADLPYISCDSPEDTENAADKFSRIEECSEEEYSGIRC